MLVSKSKVKKYIKDQCAVLRPGWKMTQVSDAAIVNLDAKLRVFIQNAIKSHPTVGKTFTFELGE